MMGTAVDGWVNCHWMWYASNTTRHDPGSPGAAVEGELGAIQARPADRERGAVAKERSELSRYRSLGGWARSEK